MVTKKIVEPVVEGNIEEHVEERKRPAPFSVRFAQLGALIREEAKNVLKFDSTVDNINYDYVDTQQYKNLVGVCCDKVGISMTCQTTDENVQIQFDNKGIMIFVVNLKMEMFFYDPFDVAAPCYKASAFGLGVSRGNGYAAGVAQTNAIRNLLTNTFMLQTNDRESDDVRENIKPQQYLTDSAKAEKREQLLETTKSKSMYATVQYGKIVYQRIKETLNKEISDEFRTTLVKFLENKFLDNGQPIPQATDDSLWIVKKAAANKILSDLDAV